MPVDGRVRRRACRRPRISRHARRSPNRTRSRRKGRILQRKSIWTVQRARRRDGCGGPAERPREALLDWADGAYAWVMPRLPFRIALFLSSYAPLFALLAWTNRGTTWVWLTLLIVAGLSVGALAVVFRSKAGDVGPRLVVARSTPDEGEVMAYLSTYLLPFLGLDLSSATGIVVFVGFLLVVGVVYVNSNMLFVNPLLSLAGYHTFRVVDTDEVSSLLVTPPIFL